MGPMRLLSCSASSAITSSSSSIESGVGKGQGVSGGVQTKAGGQAGARPRTDKVRHELLACPAGAEVLCDDVQHPERGLARLMAAGWAEEEGAGVRPARMGGEREREERERARGDITVVEAAERRDESAQASAHARGQRRAEHNTRAERRFGSVGEKANEERERKKKRYTHTHTRTRCS